jgi:hypothetical protein
MSILPFLHAACKAVRPISLTASTSQFFIKRKSTTSLLPYLFTPQYYACSNGHTDVVQILLENNCDIHDAINGACEGGYKDIVEILIKHNVDINQRGGFLDTSPIVYACVYGHTDIVKLLLDNIIVSLRFTLQ